MRNTYILKTLQRVNQPSFSSRVIYEENRNFPQLLEKRANMYITITCPSLLISKANLTLNETLI